MIPPNAGFVNNAIKTCVVEYSINSSLLILSLSLHHKRKTDGKVLSPLSAYIFLIFNTANRPQRSSTCSTSRSNARIPLPPLLCNFQSVCFSYALANSSKSPKQNMPRSLSTMRPRSSRPSIGNCMRYSQSSQKLQ